MKRHLPNLKEYIVPNSLEEAHACLISKDRSSVIAGGTSYKLFKHPNVSTLVDLSRLNLDRIINNEDHISIGSMVRIHDIVSSPIHDNPLFNLLKQASLTIGPVRLRNHITVGGNIARIFPWSNLPVALSALNAKIKVAGDTSFYIDTKTFFNTHSNGALAPGSIITDIIIPNPHVHEHHIVSSWIREGYTHFDIPYINMAVVLSIADNKVAGASIVLGGSTAFPSHLSHVESFLTNQPAHISGIYTSEYRFNIERPLDDDISRLSLTNTIKISSSYQKHIIKTLVVRGVLNTLCQ